MFQRGGSGDTPQNWNLLSAQTNVTEPKMRGLSQNVSAKWQRRHAAKLEFAIRTNERYRAANERFIPKCFSEVAAATRRNVKG